MYDKLATGNVIHAEDIVKHMGNAYIERKDTSTVEPSPCWLQVLADEKQVVQTLHLCDGEMPDIRRCVDLINISHTQLRAMQYNYIANTMPPEFITKPGYRHAHSLAHAAFECIHDKYQQLQVVQKLARLDVLDLLEDIDLYAHAEELSGKKGTHTVGRTNFAVATICALVAVIGTREDTSALTAGLGINMTDADTNPNVAVGVPDSTATTTTTTTTTLLLQSEQVTETMQRMTGSKKTGS
jgi:hypothetical protein